MLPELCSRHGQHERTLFSFLTGQHAASASSFLACTDLPARGPLPSLGLDAVYDYFVGGGALHIESASLSGRWTEIATRLRDSHGLTPQQARLAKAVALLNLVSTTGTVRASRPVLALADKGSDQGARRTRRRRDRHLPRLRGRVPHLAGHRCRHRSAARYGPAPSGAAAAG